VPVQTIRGGKLIAPTGVRMGWLPEPT
jgi:hypothetical protein